jgi:hypothetical protein
LRETYLLPRKKIHDKELLVASYLCTIAVNYSKTGNKRRVMFRPYRLLLFEVRRSVLS